MRERLQLPKELNGRVWRYANSGYPNVQHHHAELELNQVTRGTGTYLLANRRYPVRRGDLIWLFPAQEHVLIGQTSDFEMWIAVFKRKAVRAAAVDAAYKPLLRQDPGEGLCRRVAEAQHRRLDNAFAEISTTVNQPALFNAGLGYLLLRAWTSFEHAADIPVADVHPAVERAARLIREDTTGLGLEQIAHQAGLSPARLSRLFHAQTGLPMVEFRNRQRVARFIEMYGTGQRRTMLDAALDAGFGSYAQFYRVFKSVTGIAPKDYRNREADVSGA